MRSKLAEQTRSRQAEREASLTLEERAATERRTAAIALELYMQVQGVDREEAVRRLQEAGAAGRDDSRCAKRPVTR